MVDERTQESTSDIPILPDPAVTGAERQAIAAELLTEERRRKAALLLALLQRGPKTWRELVVAGPNRTEALLAAGDIADIGDDRIRVGPMLLELEPREDGA